MFGSDTERCGNSSAQIIEYFRIRISRIGSRSEFTYSDVLVAGKRENNVKLGRTFSNSSSEGDFSQLFTYALYQRVHNTRPCNGLDFMFLYVINSGFIAVIVIHTCR